MESTLKYMSVPSLYKQPSGLSCVLISVTGLHQAGQLMGQQARSPVQVASSQCLVFSAHVLLSLKLRTQICISGFPAATQATAPLADVS